MVDYLRRGTLAESLALRNPAFGLISVRSILILSLVLLSAELAVAGSSSADVQAGGAPDVRSDDTRMKFQGGNYVVVPIPISNPTLDTGLIAGAAYFYPQTEQQRNEQPASVTAAAAMYTSSDSRALAFLQQNYWNENKWRFTGAVGTADLRLTLLAPNDTAGVGNADWHIDGHFLFTRLARKLTGNWYGGVVTRIIDADQSIGLGESTPAGFDTGSEVRSVGIGMSLEFDSRDLPINSYSGLHFTLDTLLNDEAVGSNSTYQSYNVMFRSYHTIRDSLVLAWEAQACKRGGQAPLWDACTIRLRGFSATDYLGDVSSSAQVEVRWKSGKRLGLVGFAGAGYTDDSFSGVREHEPIPSYGIGVRFMVLQEKRINLRLDYARSTDSDAIHISVGEAF